MHGQGWAGRVMTALVAATLFAGSAASAAPQSLDPLVAVSVFGTAQSRAAVCATGPQGCALPMVDGAQPADTMVAPRVDSGTSIGILPLLLGLGAVAAAALLLLDGDEDADIELPVSPI